jgi:FkbM family methyltransferase
VKTAARKIKSAARRALAACMGRLGYVRRDAYERPYIIQKSTEGVDFLFHIRDQHSRLWYDLYSTDPVWLEMRFIRDQLLKHGDIAIECGSHHGATTIPLSRWVGPSGKVYAYEPGGANYGVLLENLELNGIRNVVAVQAAVGDAEGVVEFEEFPGASMASRVHAAAMPRASVPTARVRQASLEAHAAERPALIKIDTQGYVYQPLLGAKNLIRDQRPHLALEIDGIEAIREYGDNFHKIFELIEHADYDYFVAFSDAEYPARIALDEVLPRWKSLNDLSGSIHLFARNRNRAAA